MFLFVTDAGSIGTLTAEPVSGESNVHTPERLRFIFSGEVGLLFKLF